MAETHAATSTHIHSVSDRAAVSGAPSDNQTVLLHRFKIVKSYGSDGLWVQLPNSQDIYVTTTDIFPSESLNRDYLYLALEKHLKKTPVEINISKNQTTGNLEMVLTIRNIKVRIPTIDHPRQCTTIPELVLTLIHPHPSLDEVHPIHLVHTDIENEELFVSHNNQLYMMKGNASQTDMVTSSRIEYQYDPTLFSYPRLTPANVVPLKNVTFVATDGTRFPAEPVPPLVEKLFRMRWALDESKKREAQLTKEIEELKAERDQLYATAECDRIRLELTNRNLTEFRKLIAISGNK